MTWEELFSKIQFYFTHIFEWFKIVANFLFSNKIFLISFYSVLFFTILGLFLYFIENLSPNLRIKKKKDVKGKDIS